MSEPTFDIKKYLWAVIDPILNTPQDATMSISVSDGGEVTTIELYVKRSDLARMIGTKGSNFKALERILKTIEWRKGLFCTKYVLRVDALPGT